jgi:stage II sporulation protein AB (anti-sigma F factor)
MEREPTNILKMEFSSRSENVGFARTATAIFASQLDFTLDQLDEIKVAISEAVSNAIIHGYAERPGIVRMELRLYPDGLEVIVADDGPGIADLAWALQPGRTTDAERMGLGLVFIKEYMDQVEIETHPGAGTKVIMRKRLTPVLKQ